MKNRINLILIALFMATVVDAQVVFTEFAVAPPFEDVDASAIAFADVDDDDDQDVLITGFNAADERVAKLYLNDGFGVFAEAAATPFEGVSGGSIAFADVDDDDDLDVLITGTGATGTIAKLYRNNGAGVFTEVTSTPFDGAGSSDIAFADMDDDDDLDVLITGYSSTSGNIAKLYYNNGVGVFTEVIGTPFEGVYNGSVSLVDVNYDDALDVVITGFGTAGRIMKLYWNDGINGFVDSNELYDGISLGTTDFIDVNKDGQLHVLLTGMNAANDVTTSLNMMSSVGSLLSTGVPFDIVWNSVVSVADIDGDLYPDMLISGRNGNDELSTRLYRNYGSYGIVEVATSTFEGIEAGSTAFADVDGDGDQDVLITGKNAAGNPITKGYLNHTPQAVYHTDVYSVCEPFTWIDGITYGNDVTDATFTYYNEAVSGADSIVTLHLTINPALDVSTTLVGTTITANNSNATYQWVDCDNGFAEIPSETAQDFTPTGNGNYAVEITENGCLRTSDCVSILTVGLLDNVIEVFSLYPNPAKDQVSIAFNTVVSRVEVRLTNAEGKLVSTALYHNANIINMVVNQPAGMYYLSLKTERGKQTTKVTIR